jgi:S-phase kinase-associated protein 1
MELELNTSTVEITPFGSNVSVKVPLSVALQIGIVKSVIEDTNQTKIPIVNEAVTPDIFKKILEYLEYHDAHPQQTREDGTPIDNPDVTAWDQAFVNIDQDTIFTLLVAANYLEIKPLLDLTAKKIASLIKGKTVEEIRALFGITNDFTPEEEDQVRQENAWCTDN